MEDYEERYNKLVNFIKDLYPHTSDYVKEKLEGFIHELKESEDERIRKAQLDYWRSVGGKKWCGVPVQETIAWLEKQSEQKPADNYCQENCKGYRDTGGKCFADGECKAKIEAGQKSAWSEEDEKQIRQIERIVKDSGASENLQNKISNWFKSLKPNHWKPSEQNIKDLEWCADLVKDKMGVGFHRIQVFIDDLRKAMEE